MVEEGRDVMQGEGAKILRVLLIIDHKYAVHST